MFVLYIYISAVEYYIYITDGTLKLFIVLVNIKLPFLKYRNIILWITAEVC